MAVLAALGAALLYAAASVFQQRAAGEAPADRSLRLGLLVGLLARPLWLIGIVADGAGFVLQFVALDHGSLVLVQPLLVSGLLFALPFAAVFTRRRLTPSEWLGSAATVAGLSLFLVVASPGPGHDTASDMAWIITGACTLVPIVVMVAVSRSTTGAVRAGLLAAAGGVFYGLAAALTKVTAQEFHSGIVHTITSNWEPYALVVCAVVAMVVVQSAFQAGPLRWSLPTLTVVDPVVSVIIGALALGERISTRGAAPALEIIGLMFMAWGVFLVARNPLMVGAEETTATRV
ncbi:MAG TPA: DMT family transporter [Acidimicrobiales bacterium]|nr:DMT family transporter [Acidimicrobiales bacterium]